MSGRLPVVSCQLPAQGRLADSRQLPTAGSRRSGFTLVEILVAIGVATILFAICTAVVVKVSQYKTRSEKLLFVGGEANNALRRIARDVEGLYVDSQTDATEYWQVQPDAAITDSQQLALLTATENPGKADYCKAAYYVKGTVRIVGAKTWIDDGKLYRKLSDGIPPGTGWAPADDDPAWLLAEGVIGITFTTDPAGFSTNGRVPRSVTVTLKMADPSGQPRADGSQPYLLFTRTIRPGSEETP